MPKTGTTKTGEGKTGDTVDTGPSGSALGSATVSGDATVTNSVAGSVLGSATVSGEATIPVSGSALGGATATAAPRVLGQSEARIFIEGPVDKQELRFVTASVDPLRHSALSEFSIDVPHGPDEIQALSDSFARVRFEYGGEVFFRGVIEGSTASNSFGEANATLRGRGRGRYLWRGSPDSPFVVDSQTVEDALREYIDTKTRFTPQIEADPASTVETGVNAIDADTTADWEDLFETAANDATTPFHGSNGQYKVAQSCWVVEAENHRDGANYHEGDGSQFSGNSPSDGAGAAASFGAVGEAVPFSFTTDYAIPADQFDLAVHGAEPDFAGNEFEISVDGSSLGTGSFDLGSIRSWDTQPLRGTGFSQLSSDLSAGTHSVRIEMTNYGGSDATEIDLACPYDRRFSYTFNNDFQDGPNGGQWLPGPELYPDAAEVLSDVTDFVYTVDSATVASAWKDSNISGPQAIELSPNQGTDWLGASNTADFSQEFVDNGALGTTLQLRLTMGRYGQRDDATPRQGFKGQAIDAIDVDVDLSALAVIEGQTFDSDHLANIQNMCDQGDYRSVVDPASEELIVHGFKTGASTKQATFDTISVQHDNGNQGYANQVTIQGAKKPESEQSHPGERYSRTLTDQDEIDELMAIGLSEAAATIERTFTDPRLSSQSAVDRRAATRLQECVRIRAIQGDLEIVPTVVLPGYVYSVPEFDADVSLEEVSFSIGQGEASGTARFVEPEDLSRNVSRLSLGIEQNRQSL